jgi:BirA family biotin operon repressor/biotin-[acetyl-CoA-carboxylase] ligase
MTAPKLPSVYNLITLDSVDSTNSEAKKLAAEGEETAPDGTLVWAREQTGGRGRRGRTWESPSGNLYTSLILRPDVPIAEAAQLSFVAALAVYDTLGSIGPAGHQVLCKWPNDVLLNEKKVAGILMESEGGDANTPADWVILGMGLNVEWHPSDTDFPATSLRFEGFSNTVEEVLEAYTRSFMVWTNRWLNDGFAPIRQNWLWRCMGKDEKIEVRLENRTVTGVFKDMGDNGALILDVDGKEHQVTAGDVYFGI